MTTTMRHTLAELLAETNKALSVAKAEAADEGTRLLLKMTIHNIEMILEGK